ncbi:MULTISPECIES: glycosyltransferase family 32 protein [Olivibacter]|jgi:hypothetical protein|uniref:Glycosyltransferase family 32 protein n=1 Tax=Olivibacter oleidegradans TaxID=760123 RepID=A0ABV6HPG5_9SPHI|nr:MULTISPECIES: glycosyltransferase [unclassified Olivibacter]MCL4640440.1 hypothetical protein [Olivibacter sp. UJ_SKK_5.1]MDM8173690.1 glycosyltransferase [Olivibacter sp. 47]MDX3914865.1 glycosyltransferase [Pseudosphingobacterium sp.]QEL03484.1 hypothetical protein FKG96_22505 [Olivibacter sp. LS-1]
MVPTVIHQIVGGVKNDVVQHCLASWQLLKQLDFTIKYWNDDDLMQFLQSEFPFAVEAFKQARNFAEAADIARYLIVYRHGGYYIDWDVQLVIPNEFIRYHLACPKGYLLIDPVNDSLASEFFCAPPRENYLLQVAKDIVSAYESGMRDLISTPYYSGPYRMRDTLAENSSTRQQLIPVKELFEYDYNEIREMAERQPSKAAIHYWLHTWLDNVK